MTVLADAVAALAADDAVDEGAFGSELSESEVGTAGGGVGGAVLLFLYEFTAVAAGAGFSVDDTGFFSGSGFLAESVMLMERT